MENWISVEEQMPTKDETVLVYRGDLISVYTYMGNDEWEDAYGYWGRTEDEFITHWMSLPEPPMC